MLTVLEGLDEQLHEVVSPLRDRRNAIDSEIAEVSSVLERLKEARRRVQRTLQVLDPAEPAPGRPKHGAKPSTNNWQVSEKLLTDITAYLEAHRSELNGTSEGFHATGLTRRPDFNKLTSATTLFKGLHVLHERGVVALVGQGAGGAKLFRLI